MPKTIQLANTKAGIQRASLHGGCFPGALPTSERTHLIRRVGDTRGRGRTLERGSRGPRKAASRLTKEHKPQAQPRATCPRPLLRPLAQLSPLRPPIRLQTPEPPPSPARAQDGRQSPVRPGNGAEGGGPNRPRRCQLPSPPRPRPLSSFSGVFGGWC